MSDDNLPRQRARPLNPPSRLLSGDKPAPCNDVPGGGCCGEAVDRLPTAAGSLGWILERPDALVRDDDCAPDPEQVREIAERLLALRRAAGRPPHSKGEAEDALVVELIVGAASGKAVEHVVASWWSEQSEGTRREVGERLQDGESFLGLNRPQARAVDAPLERGDLGCDSKGADAAFLLSCQYGRYYQVVQDLVAMCGGVLRQFGNCDLLWRSLFNEGGSGDTFAPAPIEIPAPRELYALLRDPDGGVLNRFDLILIAAAAYGVRLVPTLFTLGGGSGLNGRQREVVDGEAGGALIDAEATDPVTFRQAQYWNPNKGLILPSEKGFADAYWRPTDVGITPSTAVETASSFGGSVEFNVEHFTRYALQLRPDTDLAPAPDDYVRESARRKCVGLIAYGQAIGEHLAEWEDALGEVGLALSDVVAYLELGNEMGVWWWPRPYGAPSWEPSARELGWFMALLAASSHAACPSLRFAAPGLAGAEGGDADAWQEVVKWHGHAIQAGMTDALSFLETVRAGLRLRAMSVHSWREWQRTYPDHAAFVATQEALDFTAWPVTVGGAIDPRTLLHQVNFHWYHANDRPEDLGRSALSAGRLVQDIDVFLETLERPTVAGARLSLTWALQEFGFPAAAPTHPGDTTRWSTLAGPLYQAGELVRVALTARARGAEMACWNTQIASVQNLDFAPAWSPFSTMGLRNDVVDGAGAASFRASVDAVRRPAWYAFRRLSRLLAQSTGTPKLEDYGDGLFVVELTARTGFQTPAEHAAPGSPGRTWPKALIAWVDLHAVDAYLDFTLLDVRDHLRVSLAPRVADDADGVVEDSGYARGGAPTWDWVADGVTLESGLYDWTTVADIEPTRLWPSTSRLDVRVRRTETSTPVPLCLLYEQGDLGAFTGAGKLPGVVTDLWGSDLSVPLRQADLLLAILSNPLGGVQGLPVHRYVRAERERPRDPWSP